FSLSSWIDLYGVNVEMPILVQYLPEGWALPSYSGIFGSIANIGPLVYAAIAVLCPGNAKTRETFTIYFIICSGAVTCILLSLFWDQTAFLWGAERSVAFFAMVFFLEFVDCTSCVVFLPFMSRFKASYMPSFMAGEEMGGMISGLVGLIQGVGGEPVCTNITKEVFNETGDYYYNLTTMEPQLTPPRFSVSAFFIFLFCIMCLSAISFTLLNYTQYCQKEMTQTDCAQKKYEEQETMISKNAKIELNENVAENEEIGAIKIETTWIQKLRFPILVFYFAYASFFMYGLSSAVMSYAVLPYGYFEYNLSLRLSTLIKPLAALSTSVLETSSLAVIGGCILVANGMSFFSLYLALMSPDPPLAGADAGSIMVVIVGVTMTTFYSYARTSTVTLLRKEGGHRGLLWAGFSVQAGAFLGTILGFLLVNVFEIFKDKPRC
ncbi:hypothetical protein CAPTEDRAFT_73779, partial [Capitella teleta]